MSKSERQRIIERAQKILQDAELSRIKHAEEEASRGLQYKDELNECDVNNSSKINEATFEDIFSVLHEGQHVWQLMDEHQFMERKVFTVYSPYEIEIQSLETSRQCVVPRFKLAANWEEALAILRCEQQSMDDAVSRMYNRTDEFKDMLYKNQIPSDSIPVVGKTYTAIYRVDSRCIEEQRKVRDVSKTEVFYEIVPDDDTGTGLPEHVVPMDVWLKSVQPT
jgi:hypothetical protein